MGARVRILLLLVLVLSFLPATAGEDAEPGRLPIWCGALAEEATVYTSAPIGGAYRTDLVVVGTARKTEEGRCEITVTETLFGVPPAPVLTVRQGPEGRFIFTFQVSNYGYGTPDYSDYRCGGYLPVTPANLAGARALSNARLLTVALSARAVFTGTLSVDPEDDDRISVSVTGVLSGTGLKVGETVLSERPARMWRLTGPWDESREVLCFVGGHDGDLFRWGGHQPLPPDIRRILPGELAGQVRRVLPLRDSLPVHRLNRKEVTDVREVVFTGTIEGALLILTSDCYGARSLASRSLIRRGGEARAPVLAAIRKQLFDLEVTEPDRYRTLQYLIWTLRDIESRDPQGDLAQLAEEWFDFLESGAPFAPVSPADFPRSFRGKRWHPVNKALLWCLNAIGSVRVRSEFGDRLLRLRETAPAGWQPYVTEIIERHQVVEARELPTALQAAKAKSVRRGPPGPVPTLSHSSQAVAYSEDGKWLAFHTGNWIQLCRAEDYEAVSRIRYERSVNRIRFSRDGGWLWIDGYDTADTRYRVPSGEQDPDGTPEGEWPRRRISSSDGRTFVVLNSCLEPGMSFSGSPGLVEVFHIQPGGRERIGALGLESATMAQYGFLSPDGGMLALAGNGNVVRLFSVPDLEPKCEFTVPLPRASGLSIESMAFRPDGKVLALATREAYPVFFDLENHKRVRPFTGHSEEIDRVAFAEGNTVILTRARDRTVCAFSPETGAFLGRVEAPAGFEFAGEGGLERSRILAVEEGHYSDEWPGGRRAIVLDARAGQRCWESRLPEGANTRDARWRSEKSILYPTRYGEAVQVFDFETGKVTRELDCSAENIHFGLPSEDGAWLFAPAQSGKGSRPATIRRLDLQTSEQSTQPIPGHHRLRGRLFGLVPGGKWLFFADPDVLVLDRKTLATISQRRLPTINQGELAFSGDGLRYAIAVSVKKLPEEVQRLCPEGTKSLVRIHATKSGHTLLAFPTRSYSPVVALNADGTKLVYVEDDGQVAVIDL